MPSTEIALPLSAQLQRALDGEDVFDIVDTDPDIVNAQIVAQILSAGTIEEVFDNGGTIATMKLVGEVLVLRDVKLLPSAIQPTKDQPNPPKVYAILEVANSATGEIRALNTGSPRIMAQACRAKDLDALPLEVRIVEVAKAKPGRNAPLGLELLTP
jgi:hypothetical protein